MLIVLCFGISLSILLDVIYRNLWAWSVPWLCAYFLEYILRVSKGDFTPPLVNGIIGYFRGVKFKKKRQVVAENQQKPKVAFKISNISELTIKDFIQCKFFGNYECLKLHIAIYTDADIENHFYNLCQQYQEAKKDKNISEYAKLKGGIMAIEYGWAIVNIWANMLNERYSHPVADGLRKLYPQFKFSHESWRDDLVQVKDIEETKGRMKYDRLGSSLNKLESLNSVNISNKDQYSNFLSTIRDCSKLFGTIDINTTYMDMMAVYEIGLQEEIKRLDEEIRKNK